MAKKKKKGLVPKGGLLGTAAKLLAGRGKQLEGALGIAEKKRK